MPREIARQTFHMVIGIVVLIVLFLFGPNALMAFVFFSLLIGFLLVNQISLGKRYGIVQWFVDKFERPNQRFPGWGSACYGLGVLMLAAYLRDPLEIAASIFILAVGDSVSTLVGRNGWHRLPWSESKTMEGTLAFFLSCLPAYFFVGWVIVPIAAISALVESFDFPVDDNLMIPIACICYFFLV